MSSQSQSLAPSGNVPAGPVLGIDAGGSSTRWLLIAEDGSELARGVGGPVSAVQLRTGEAGATTSRLAGFAETARRVEQPTRVVAGVTGLERSSWEAGVLTEALSEVLGLPPAHVKVMPDVEVAYRAAFEPGEGVLVYAGTGSVALYLDRSGHTVRAGGHGYLIDDAGGGYWIGREALKSLLREADETGSPATGLLAEGAFDALGGDDWNTIRREVYEGGRSRVASLTKVVAAAAEAGDVGARRLLAAAGAELARLAMAVSARVRAATTAEPDTAQALPVALAGGVARCGEFLTRALRSGLPAGTDFRISDKEPVEAAAELARVGYES